MQCTDSHRIAPEGYPFIGTALVLTAASVFVHSWLFLFFLALSVFITAFFRNPRRVIPAGENLLVSPADGKVIFSGEINEDRFLKKRMRKISIFMSPLNVHINRIPWGGVIRQVAYNKGKYLAAWASKSSLDNEQNAVLIEDGKGRQVLCVQIAGFLARRIVCYAHSDEKWGRGAVYGLIRFGSRMDVYMPCDARVKINAGQKVKGGETILAELS